MAHDLRSLPAAYAEFPNDNPDLYRHVTLDPSDALPPIEIVDELYFNGAFDDAIDEPPVLEATDSFAAFASLLDRAARSVSEDEFDSSLLKGLLGLIRMQADAPSALVMAALQAGDIVIPNARGIARTERFTRQVQGWQGILRGDSEDFGPCGAQTLDEWASDLVARLLGNAARAPSVRREVRRLGVAAFGLVTNAA